jgi:hypothetical protein
MDRAGAIIEIQFRSHPGRIVSRHSRLERAMVFAFEFMDQANQLRTERDISNSIARRLIVQRGNSSSIHWRISSRPETPKPWSVFLAGPNLIAHFHREIFALVFRESEMSPVLVIVERVGRHRPCEMPLIQDDHVLKQVASASNTVKLQRTSTGT